MEVFNVVLQAISTIGFPIVFCLIMFKHMAESENKHYEEMQKIADVMQNNTDAVNNNTMIVHQVLEKLNNME